MTAWSDYDVLGQIGRGQFSEVDAVRFRSTGQIYACKRINKLQAHRSSNVLDVRRERDILDLPRTGHEYYADLTPKLFHAFQSQSQLIIVQTYYACGSLWDIMSDRARSRPSEREKSRFHPRSSNPGLLSVQEIRHYAAQIALAIGYLHDSNIVHRDVKPHNVLIGLKAQAVLSDFGSAAALCEHAPGPQYTKTPGPSNRYEAIQSIIMRQGRAGGILSSEKDLWRSPKSLPRTACLSLHGTLDYIAPEVLVASEQSAADEIKSRTHTKKQTSKGPTPKSDDSGYDHSVDWWSWGAMLFEMASGLPPFYEEEVAKTYQRIIRFTKTAEVPLCNLHNLDLQLVDMLKGVLSVASHRLGRRGPIEIVTQPFFAEFDWQECIRGRLSPEFPPPPPVDVEDLCDSFLGDDWSAKSDDTTSGPSSMPADPVSLDWKGWDRFVGPSAADIMFPSTDPHSSTSSSQSRSADPLPYQTPMRIVPLKACATPYPPGTALRKARSIAPTIRKMSEKTVFERVLACVQASSRKRFEESRTGRKPLEPLLIQPNDFPDDVLEQASINATKSGTRDNHIQEIVDQSVALRGDLSLINDTLARLAVAIRDHTNGH